MSVRRRSLWSALVAVLFLAGCVIEDPSPTERLDPSLGVGTFPVRAVSYGPADAHRADVHLPAGWRSGDRRPVVVFFHGGAWMSGDRSMVPDVVRAQLRRGWVVVSADYRLAPASTWPAPVYDADRAVRWVRANAEALGVDRDRLVVAGDSAGGHLALLAATAAGRFVDSSLPSALRVMDPRPNGVVTLAAPVDLTALNFSVLGWTSTAVLARLFACSEDRCDPAVLAVASPLQHVSDDDPPAYIAHGVDDDVVDVEQAYALYRAFAEQGLASNVRLDIVDHERRGGRTIRLPAAVRGHEIDAGVHLGALETFLDGIGRNESFD